MYIFDKNANPHSIMKYITLLLFIASKFTCCAQTHQLVTTTRYGGNSGNGAIFISDSNGGNFHPVYSFTASTGVLPVGNLTLDTGGIVFGVTELGGPSDSCVVFSYNPATNMYNMLHDFGQTENLGWWDQTGPVLLPDGNLYGLGQDGGLYNGGTIYKLNPVTQAYQDLFDFDTTGTSGIFPESGLLYSGGLLYGTSIEAGTYGKGTIFSFDPITDSFSALHQFIDSSGSNPATGSLMMASNHTLYGVTKSGGAPYSAGAIFSYNLATHTYTCRHKFNPLYDGADPNNALLQATDGKLYGLANDAAQYSAGTLFRYDIQNDSFITLYTFDVTHGAKPLSSLSQAWNGNLYGTTSAGGAHNAGVIFSYNIDSSKYSVVYEFDSVTGNSPAGAVLDYYKKMPVLPNKIALVQSSPDFQIMPNPASSTIFIKSFYPIKELKITDISGRQYPFLAKTISQNSWQVDGLQSLANGMYLITLLADDISQTEIIVLQK
jgi:uncharacterized repeat protein (TIGR03803 family)